MCQWHKKETHKLQTNNVPVAYQKKLINYKQTNWVDYLSIFKQTDLTISNSKPGLAWYLLLVKMRKGDKR